MDERSNSAATAFTFRADALRERLFETDMAVYVFVDPLLADPFRQRLELDSVKARRVELLRYGLSVEQYPYIVQLASSTDDLLEASLALVEKQAQSDGQSPSVCGWFQSSLPPHEIATRLRNSMVYHLPDGRRWLFRFFDPRVACRLPKIVGSSWKPTGVHAWWSMADGHWQQLPGDMERRSPALPSDLQRATIDRMGIVNQALTQWRKMQAELPANSYWALDEAVAKRNVSTKTQHPARDFYVTTGGKLVSTGVGTLRSEPGVSSRWRALSARSGLMCTAAGGSVMRGGPLT